MTRTPIHHVDWRADQYISGTFGILSIEEHGLYVVVLSAIYSAGGPVANDLGYFTHACKGTHWRTVKAALAGLIAKGKLTVGPDGRLSNGRAERELWAARNRVHNAHRAAHIAGQVHAVDNKVNSAQDMLKTVSRRAHGQKIYRDINAPSEPTGAHHQPPYDHDHDSKISTDAARDPAPDQTAPAAQGRAPKHRPTLEQLAKAARARLLKGQT